MKRKMVSSILCLIKEKMQALKKYWMILTTILCGVLIVGFAYTSFDLCQKSEAFYLENSLQDNFIGTDMASFQMLGEGNLIDRSFMLSGTKLLGEVDMAKFSHLEIKARLGSAKVYFLPKGEKKAIRLSEGRFQFQAKGKLILIGRFFTGSLYFYDQSCP